MAHSFECMNSSNADGDTGKLHPGGLCEIYSNSHKKWTLGRIVSKEERADGVSYFNVEYKISGQFISKKVRRDDESCIRCYNPNTSCITENRITCPCGEDMTRCTIAEAYERKVGGEEQDTKEEKSQPVAPETPGGRCDHCSSYLQASDLVFHCPKGKTEIHLFGYDICIPCATGVGPENVQPSTSAKTETTVEEKKTDSEPEEKSKSNTIAMQLGLKPFSEGGVRYAYLGQYTIPEKKGLPCVVKKCKESRYYSDEMYAGDLKCYELAAKLVNEWNAMNRVEEKYEMIIPTIARKGEPLDDLLSQLLLALLPEKDREEIIKRRQQDQILLGEIVIIEDFIKGAFVKWNSNSGWINTLKDDASIQAFCHWTYHQSKGQYLFCDAQGVRRRGKYVLTDPCILSIEGDVYGTTDVGKHYMWNWFRRHTCNKFCDKSWSQPTPENFASIPDDIKELGAHTVYSKQFSSLVDADQPRMVLRLQTRPNQIVLENIPEKQVITELEPSIVIQPRKKTFWERLFGK